MSKIEKTRMPDLKPSTFVDVKKCGNVIEIRHMERSPAANTLKLDADHYIVIHEGTGEVHEYRHTDTRIENVINLKQSMKRLRDIINTNVTDPSKARWVTLTYADNMTSQVRLYNDFRKFISRLRNYIKKHFKTNFEYISVAEPQARGAWHMHCLFIFPEKAPFIPNKKLAQIWENGFVSIKALENIDNVGVYLSAYLSDLEIEDALATAKTPIPANALKEVELSTSNDGKHSKAFIKGSRLKLYPTGFRLYTKTPKP